MKKTAGPGRLLIGCVTENNEKYHSQALRLVQSIRWFGGKISRADIIVCFVDRASPRFVEKLKKWDVKVKVVKRFSQSHPHSNKLRFLELPEVNQYDTVMLLDCDTIVVRDPSPYMDGKHFQAKMADLATFPYSRFKKIFKHYNLPLPKRKYTTTVNRKPIIWYCNSGVLIFPKPILKTLFPLWKNYTEDITKRKKLMGDRYTFCEQVSLSLAYYSNPVPFKQLPAKMNFPLVPRHVISGNPCIIHYHSKVNDAGFLKNISKNPFAQKSVQKFNRYLDNFRNSSNTND